MTKALKVLLSAVVCQHTQKLEIKIQKKNFIWCICVFSSYIIAWLVVGLDALKCLEKLPNALKALVVGLDALKCLEKLPKALKSARPHAKRIE